MNSTFAIFTGEEVSGGSIAKAFGSFCLLFFGSVILGFVVVVLGSLISNFDLPSYFPLAVMVSLGLGLSSLTIIIFGLPRPFLPFFAVLLQVLQNPQVFAHRSWNVSALGFLPLPDCRGAGSEWHHGHPDSRDYDESLCAQEPVEKGRGDSLETFPFILSSFVCFLPPASHPHMNDHACSWLWATSSTPLLSSPSLGSLHTLGWPFSPSSTGSMGPSLCGAWSVLFLQSFLYSFSFCCGPCWHTVCEAASGYGSS